MQSAARTALVVLLVIVVLACAVALREMLRARGALLAATLSPATYLGGAAAKRPAGDIVVDTLNLTHWMRKKDDAGKPLTTDDVIATIGATAARVRAAFPGRVMYVVKDRESALNTPEVRTRYADAARHNRVVIYVVERYEDPPAGEGGTPRKAPSKRPTLRGKAPTQELRAPHSARGRDDFYMALLAARYRCPVLTEDRFRDFDQFRANIGAFRVHEFAHWRDAPEHDYVRPASPAHRTLRRPRSVRYAEVFADSAFPGGAL